MRIEGVSALVTGGASGLGRACAEQLLQDGAARVVLFDLPTSDGEATAAELGDQCHFVAGDVRDEATVAAALNAAVTDEQLRVLVHCAGRGGSVRLVGRDGEPGSLQTYSDVVTTNLVGTYNVLRLAASRMAKNDPRDGDRGVCVLTASVAAFEGQVGQTPYASAKAGVVGMTLVAARDLAHRAIRVCTIAPGTFDTPLLARLPEDVKSSLAASVPHPSRLGAPAEFAQLAASIVENGMLNGETIRLDGAIRMGPR